MSRTSAFTAGATSALAGSSVLPKDLILRPGRPDDAQVCGEICHHAFAAISNHHNFPPDFPNPEAACGLLSFMLARPDIYSVVAEAQGKIVGSNFLWEGDAIAGVGPITVDPNVQNSAVGRRMMENVLERARTKQFAGVRLVQAAFHNRSLSLYTKLGFDVQEPLALMQGSSMGIVIPGHHVRAAAERDAFACNTLCIEVHGHDRATEVRDSISQGTAMVVEHDGRITGYATLIGFFGHAVGETTEDIKALIGAAKAIAGPGFLLPTRNAPLFRWCLQHGLRVVQPMTLMSLGLYKHPARSAGGGAFLPSILY